MPQSHETLLNKAFKFTFGALLVLTYTYDLLIIIASDHVYFRAYKPLNKSLKPPFLPSFFQKPLSDAVPDAPVGHGSQSDADSSVQKVRMDEGVDSAGGGRGFQHGKQIRMFNN